MEHRSWVRVRQVFLERAAVLQNTTKFASVLWCCTARATGTECPLADDAGRLQLGLHSAGGSLQKKSSGDGLVTPGDLRHTEFPFATLHWHCKAETSGE
jgi:predicted metal-binding transcription factor (methanogenesis marker protein 9)